MTNKNCSNIYLTLILALFVVKCLATIDEKIDDKLINLIEKYKQVKHINKYEKSSIDSNINEVYSQPEQIHISLGLKPTQMMITWVTLDLVNDSVVEYGVNNLNMQANGTYFVFTDGGVEHRTMNIHRVLLDNLQPGQTYS